MTEKRIVRYKPPDAPRDTEESVRGAYFIFGGEKNG